MPVELDSHEPDDSIDVQPGTNEAAALCFLYANAEFGFMPAEVRDHTSIPKNSAYKALVRLKEKDLIGKTADGYYHALEDPHVARYAESLRRGAAFELDVGEDAYPDDIDQTSRGFPADDVEGESVVEGSDETAGKESFPDDEPRRAER